MSWELWVLVLSAGAMGQFIDAVAGMGFGAFSSTIMLAGGVPPVTVVGTVNLAKVGSGLVSGISHWRFGNVRWHWILPLVLSGVAGGVIGALVLTRMPLQVARLWVPAMLLAMGLLILRRFLFARQQAPRVAGASVDTATMALPVWQRPLNSVICLVTKFRLAAIGFVAGAINALSGAYGPFATSSVLLAKGGHPRYVIGTVNLAEFFVAGAISVTLILHPGTGIKHWQLPVALVLGSVLTAPLGAYLSRRVSPRILGIVVGLTMIAINIWAILRVVS